MESSTQNIKQRFGIIGNDPILNRSIAKAMRVSPTDISVLVTGESGVGKESFPKIIHQLSHRKHNKYIAVNCGAIPDGTIDSELFGHEKGAFTGANNARKGYFEVADGGTIFLDEVGELPLTTQVRLLRVLENGEYIKVGASEVQKTNVRIVAATNLDMEKAIQKGKFREDLYYRLSTVEIKIPPLRNRREDIHLLFRKFASDFAKKYNMPTIRLDENAQHLLNMYRWNGNIRQLRNVAEQLSVLEEKREVSSQLLQSYLPEFNSTLPALINQNSSTDDFSNEREILYKILFDMKKDLNDLKKITSHLNKDNFKSDLKEKDYNSLESLQEKLNEEKKTEIIEFNEKESIFNSKEDKYHFAEEINEEETLSIHDIELELIKKALERNNGKRKAAAIELGISERTLYRKIKQHDIEL
ncbi:sigma-54 dependent transcriptional regulator [Flavobacteriaceae bacterium]|jgi:DNA-binding NtrC family response regulator|nr:sigma-54 dependent transcriptional regulator [Flavobacteriaceae bacterium]MDB4049745.1 sigma-54 dependent transcriptional regulator [Flavobacteriaceae bacterium]MDB4087224.1 sigma-54 dependent transcriptional regulator [Flavobacteriaceae bacterium]MDB4239986.1 sigma-54 dependent transcriptional regulator [Flavobacteriaceae bacterium]MDB9787654.1 sigma-54 dependent transcriptional regulator [Flavobacteriaceae bacterium]